MLIFGQRMSVHGVPLVASLCVALKGSRFSWSFAGELKPTPGSGESEE